MKKSIKITLGISNLLPILYMGVFFTLFFSMLFHKSSSFLSKILEGGFAQLAPFLILHFAAMILTLFLFIFYIKDVLKNDKIEKEKKNAWLVALFLGNILAMPIYWYLFIWKDSKEKEGCNQPN